MSDANAIEAVTEALVQLVLEGAREVERGVKVEARPPDETPGPSGDPQLNLFLYQISIDEGLRNEDPVGLRPGEHGDPQLPLVLHYLLTAFVPGGDVIAHRMLGGAMRMLHENPHLSRERLRHVVSPSDVSEQPELIRLTWQSFAEKDIYSLWSAFQTSYRLTVAFEARPVLIDSRRPPRLPVPVLRWGARDLGPEAVASVESPFPQLNAAVPVVLGPDGSEHEEASVKLGGRVVLRGAHLDQANEVRLTHPLLAEPVSIPVVPGSAAEVRFELTGPPQAFPAGLWSVALVSGTTETNAVSLAVAPEITSRMPMTVHRTGSAAVVRLACRPPVRVGQPVLLVLGSRSVLERRAVAARPEDPVTGADLIFEVPDAPVGTHLARLRIGGVDSLLVDRTGPKPKFDATQTVTIS
ncbi:DUF4255 domain-containing protein [Amycolatopsis sp. WGS_07]|uniref:DUF4255 domain-containing protein n=1 Tax=Amycolatopsis sp. WGS_07 TaxID=3076764 RepID=UPI0038737DA7